MIKIIAITKESYDIDEADICNNLFENGLEILHCRKPTSTEKQLTSLIEKIDKKFHNKIVIHNNYNIAKRFKLRGIHLKSNLINKYNKFYEFQHISTSCHSFSEIQNLNYDFNYCFLSPIFDSISKENYKSNFNIIEIESGLRNVSQKVYALGGVDINNIELVIKMGFDGAALLGYIWNNNKAVENLIAIYKKIK